MTRLKKRMGNEFLPPESALTVDDQHFFEELSHFCRGSVPVEAEFFSLEYLLGAYFLVHLVGVGGAVGHLSEDHLEENDADGPDISLGECRSTFRP